MADPTTNMARRRAPGTTLLELKAWANSLGSAAEGKEDMKEKPLNFIVDAILSKSSSSRPKVDPNASKSAVVLYPIDMPLKQIIECLEQNERCRLSDMYTAYSFKGFERLFRPEEFVEMTSSAVFLVMSSWSDGRLFQDFESVQVIVEMDVSRVFSEIGSVLRVCLPRDPFERVKDRKLNNRNAGIVSEILPQLFINASLARNQAYALRSDVERNTVASRVIVRMLEWFLTIVFVPLDGDPAANSEPPREYSLLRRQMNAVTFTANKIMKERERERERERARESERERTGVVAAGEASMNNDRTAEALHIVRWVMTQNELRWPGQYQNLRSMLLVFLASHTESIEESVSSWLEAIRLDKQEIESINHQEVYHFQMRADLEETRKRLTKEQEPLQSATIRELENIDERLAELDAKRKESLKTKAEVTTVRFANMQTMMESLLESPKFCNLLDLHYLEICSLYEELLRHDRDTRDLMTHEPVERHVLKKFTMAHCERLQMAGCLFQIVYNRTKQNQYMARAMECIEDIIVLRKDRLKDAPHELFWELSTIGKLAKDAGRWDKAEEAYTLIINRVYPSPQRVVEINLVAVLNDLSYVYVHKGDLRNAAVLSLQALGHALQIHPLPHPDVVECYKLLSRIHQHAFRQLEMTESDMYRAFVEATDDNGSRRRDGEEARSGVSFDADEDGFDSALGGEDLDDEDDDRATTGSQTSSVALIQKHLHEETQRQAAARRMLQDKNQSAKTTAHDALHRSSTPPNDVPHSPSKRPNEAPSLSCKTDGGQTPGELNGPARHHESHLLEESKIDDMKYDPSIFDKDDDDEDEAEDEHDNEEDDENDEDAEEGRFDDDVDFLGSIAERVSNASTWTSVSSQFRNCDDDLEKLPCPPDWHRISQNLRLTNNPKENEHANKIRVIQRIRYLKEFNQIQYQHFEQKSKEAKDQLSQRNVLRGEIARLKKEYDRNMRHLKVMMGESSGASPRLSVATSQFASAFSASVGGVEQVPLGAGFGVAATGTTSGDTIGGTTTSSEVQSVGRMPSDQSSTMQSLEHRSLSQSDQQNPTASVDESGGFTTQSSGERSSASGSRRRSGDLNQHILDQANLAQTIALLYQRNDQSNEYLEMFRASLDLRLKLGAPSEMVMNDIGRLADEFVKAKQLDSALSLFTSAIDVLRNTHGQDRSYLLIGKALANKAIVLQMKRDEESVKKAAELFEESVSLLTTNSSSTILTSLNSSSPSHDDMRNDLARIYQQLFVCYTLLKDMDRSLIWGRKYLAMLPPGERIACDMRLELSRVLLAANRADEALAEYQEAEKTLLAKHCTRDSIEFFPALAMGIQLCSNRRDFKRAEELARGAWTLLSKHRSENEKYAFCCETLVPVLLERATALLASDPIQKRLSAARRGSLLTPASLWGVNENGVELAAATNATVTSQQTADVQEGRKLAHECELMCKAILEMMDIQRSAQDKPGPAEHFAANLYMELGRAHALQGALLEANSKYERAHKIISRLVNHDIKHPFLAAVSAELDRVRDVLEEQGAGEEVNGRFSGMTSSQSGNVMDMPTGGSANGNNSQLNSANSVNSNRIHKSSSELFDDEERRRVLGFMNTEEMNLRRLPESENDSENKSASENDDKIMPISAPKNSSVRLRLFNALSFVGSRKASYLSSAHSSQHESAVSSVTSPKHMLSSATSGSNQLGGDLGFETIGSDPHRNSRMTNASTQRSAVSQMSGMSNPRGSFFSCLGCMRAPPPPNNSQ